MSDDDFFLGESKGLSAFGVDIFKVEEDPLPPPKQEKVEQTEVFEEEEGRKEVKKEKVFTVSEQKLLVSWEQALQNLKNENVPEKTKTNSKTKKVKNAKKCERKTETPESPEEGEKVQENQEKGFFDFLKPPKPKSIDSEKKEKKKSETIPEKSFFEYQEEQKEVKKILENAEVSLKKSLESQEEHRRLASQLKSARKEGGLLPSLPLSASLDMLCSSSESEFSTSEEGGLVEGSQGAWLDPAELLAPGGKGEASPVGEEGEEVERGEVEKDRKGTESLFGAPKKVDHLLLLVHGIGATEEILTGNVENVSTTLEFIHEMWFQDVEVEIKVEMMNWKSSISADQQALFDRITPNTLRDIRMFLNLLLSDVVYYTTNNHREIIVNAVGNLINAKVAQLKHDFPLQFDHPGLSISIVGHSLGSVIVYDLLSHQTNPRDVFPQFHPNGRPRSSAGLSHLPPDYLTFPVPQLTCRVDRCFLLGSPLAAFLSIQSQKFQEGKFSLPSFLPLFNLFHPRDPIAFRLEPLYYHQEEGVLKPHLLSFWENNGIRTAKAWEHSVEEATNALSKKWNNFSNLFKPSKKKEPVSSPGGGGEVDELLGGFGFFQGMHDPCAELDCDEGGESLGITMRIDYALQESMAEHMSGWLSMIQAHTCYWKHRDVMLFVFKTLTGKTPSQQSEDPEQVRSHLLESIKGPLPVFEDEYDLDEELALPPNARLDRLKYEI